MCSLRYKWCVSRRSFSGPSPSVNSLVGHSRTPQRMKGNFYCDGYDGWILRRLGTLVGFALAWRLVSVSRLSGQGQVCEACHRWFPVPVSLCIFGVRDGLSEELVYEISSESEVLVHWRPAVPGTSVGRCPRSLRPCPQFPDPPKVRVKGRRPFVRGAAV